MPRNATQTAQIADTNVTSQTTTEDPTVNAAPEQTAPEQTAPEQTAPEQTAPEQTAPADPFPGITAILDALAAECRSIVQTTAATPAVLAMIEARDNLKKSPAADALAPAIASLDEQIDAATGAIASALGATVYGHIAERLAPLANELAPKPAAAPETRKPGRPKNAETDASIVNVSGTRYVRSMPPMLTYDTTGAATCGKCLFSDQTAYVETSDKPSIGNIRQNLTGRTAGSGIASMTDAEIEQHRPCMVAMNLAISDKMPHVASATVYSKLA